MVGKERINLIISNLQQDFGIEIMVERFKNTFIVKIEKNDSTISGEHKMFPENESLAPYLEEMTPENNGLSPEENSDSSTKPNIS